MKYSLGDYIKTIVIGLLVFSFLLIIFVILKFDYNLGVNCCNKNNIPLDFVLPVSGISRKWNAKMLDTILQNQTYIGSLVQCKRTRISHKTHNIVRVPEDEWVISNEKHNAIINEKNFNQVQDILYNRNVRVNKEGKFYKYTGFLRCSECGANLYRLTKIKNKKEKIDDTISLSRAEYNAEIKKIRIVEIDKELEKYKSLLNELLKDYKCDFVSEKDYDDFKQKYLYEINKLNIEKENLKINKINSYDFEWLNKFKKTGIIESVDRNIVDSFIKNIFVDNEKGVDIIFRYSDQYKLAERYLKKQNDVV